MKYLDSWCKLQSSSAMALEVHALAGRWPALVKKGHRSSPGGLQSFNGFPYEVDVIGTNPALAGIKSDQLEVREFKKIEGVWIPLPQNRFPTSREADRNR
ncbi:MAG: hypothetical protein IPH64_09650 [Comamonadaceae bacterium]|nr:hypothetical protein [Comamonadaceae bacterium]